MDSPATAPRMQALMLLDLGGFKAIKDTHGPGPATRRGAWSRNAYAARQMSAISPRLLTSIRATIRSRAVKQPVLARKNGALVASAERRARPG